MPEGGFAVDAAVAIRSTRRIRSEQWFAPSLAVLAAVVLFVFLHLRDVVLWHSDFARVDTGGGYGDAGSLGAQAAASLFPAIAVFAAWMTLTIVIGTRRSLPAWATPVPLLVVTFGPTLIGALVHTPTQPATLAEYFRPGVPGVLAAIDVLLAGAPGLMLAYRRRGKWVVPDRMAIAGLALVLFAGVIVAWTKTSLDANGVDPRTLAVAGALFIAGAGIGSLGLRCAGLMALLVALIQLRDYWYAFTLVGVTPQGVVRTMIQEASAPLIVGSLMIFAGASWRLAAVGLAWLRKRSFVALIALNVLNVADAILTDQAIRSGEAVESNPLIRAAGLPAKLLVVALASWLVWRMRPRALVWPVAILAGVLAYHMGGFVLKP